VIVVTDFFDYSFNWLVPIFRWLLVALNLADDAPPARSHVNEASSVNDSLIRLHGTLRGVNEAREGGVSFMSIAMRAMIDPNPSLQTHTSL
jgi:hypothetical protein